MRSPTCRRSAPTSAACASRSTRRKRCGRTPSPRSSRAAPTPVCDFALASFLLSVLGEGSFLNLLGFLHVHAPDRCTAELMRLSAQDEARHVAFGMSHLRRHVARDPALLGRLRLAIERRHEALRHTAGLNADVFDALVVLAAGERSPAGIARGHAAVAELQQQMHASRQARLLRLGFASDDAALLSALHTRNFM